MCQEVNWGYGHKAQPFPCVGDPRLCVSSHENPAPQSQAAGRQGSPSPPLAPRSQAAVWGITHLCLWYLLVRQHWVGVGSHLQLLIETDRRGGSTLYLVRSHKLLAVLTRSKSLPLVLLFLPCKPDKFSLKTHGDSSLKLVDCCCLAVGSVLKGRILC